MSSICLVHLVWAPLGIAPFAEFVASYKDREAGIDHDLLVIFKAFRSDDERAVYDRLLAGIPHVAVPLSDRGLDILPYFIVARRFPYRFYCFLNSYSAPLHVGWLAKMHRPLARGEAGVVGATGSLESYYSNLLRTGPAPRTGSVMADSARTLLRKWKIWKARSEFDHFPNHHIRTNGFMIGRDVMLRLSFRGERSKMDSLRFESGKAGLTRQVCAMNLKAVVVGCDGKAYEKCHWYESGTFRSGEQENLLIADNRTRQYADADPATRRMLSDLAWGRH